MAYRAYYVTDTMTGKIIHWKDTLDQARRVCAVENDNCGWGRYAPRRTDGGDV